MNKLLAAIATAGSLLAVQADAMGVNVTSITGKWTATTGTTASGLGTSSIRWGNPAPAGGPQSGYDYVAAATPINNIAPDAVFGLGTFRHLNNPIFDPVIDGATLELVIGLNVDNTLKNITQTYSFTHLETDNGDRPCDNGGANGVGVNINGCADRVTAALKLTTGQSFTIGSDEYVFKIDGFKVGNTTFTEFWTVERDDNEATLQGSYTLKSNIGVVPVPAAGVLLFTVMAGIGVMSRRRKAA